VEPIIYLEYAQNCFLRCGSTYVAEWEGTEESGEGIQKVGRIARGYGHRAESEKESYVKEDRDILEERETGRT